jgi:hypothetical protein
MLEGEALHLVFAFLLLGVGAVAFISGFIRPRAFVPLLLGMGGTALLFAGALNPVQCLSERGSHAVTIAGTLVLIFAHVKNRAARREVATGR